MVLGWADWRGAQVDGKTVVVFSRADVADVSSDQDMVFAFHDSSADIAYHTQANRGVFTVNFASGASTTKGERRCSS